MVERVLGKDEVTGSIPVNGSILPRNKLFAAGFAIGCYFLLLSYRGIFAYFTPDDVTNIQFLHGYGRVPFPVVLAHAIATFTPEYRPVGGVYYRALYAVFGFHPLPFRLAFFGLLFLNLFLAGRWLRILSRSSAVALFATLFYGFHPALSQLYFNDGTIYDVLCLLFLVLALSVYVRVRQAENYLETRQMIQIACLFALALGSKEMAIMLPAIFLLYEIVFWPKRTDVFVRLQPVLLTAAMALLCISIKVFVPNQLSMNELYNPFRPVQQIGAGYLHYHRLLFLSPALGPIPLVGILTLALCIGVALRSRLMIFGLLFTLITLVPVCVIAPRAGFVWYLPLLGYALYLGAAFAQLTSFRPALLEPAVFCGLMVLLIARELPLARDAEHLYTDEQTQLRTLVDAVKSSAASLPQNSRVLLIEDPLPRQHPWSALFAIRLVYRDPTIWVDRAFQLGRAYNPSDVSLYAMTLDWDGSKYSTRVQPQPEGTPIQVIFTPPVVHRNQEAELRLGSSSGRCRLDTAYRMPDDELLRSGVWSHWTDLNSAATGIVHIDQDAERGRIDLDRVRLCQGPWVPARGSFVIVP